MFLTLNCRLLPSQAKHKRPIEPVECQRLLHNAALEGRIACCTKTGKSLTYLDQTKALAECRRELPETSGIPAQLRRGRLKRLEEAYEQLCRRMKRGEKPGFPRFKGRGWFDTAEFAEFFGIPFDGMHPRSKAFGSVRVNMHRPMPGEIRSCKIARDVRNPNVCFQVEVEAPLKKVVRSAAGPGVCLTKLATLSTGESISPIKAARRAEKELRRKQRHVERCKRGSNGRRKARAHVAARHRKVRNVRRTCAHQQSAALVADRDLISVQNPNMNGLAPSRHAKGGHDAGWSMLVAMPSCKAEKPGGTLLRVDPKWTSRDCSSCGGRVPKGLRERRHGCPSCGLALDRDRNAAISILRKAAGGAATPGERARGNTALEKSE